MSAAQRLVAPCPAAAMLGAVARRAALRCAPAAASASARAAPLRALHVAAAARGEAAASDAAGEPARAPLRRTPPPRKPPAMGEAAAPRAAPPPDGEAPAAPAAPAASYDAASGASSLPLPPVAALFDRHYSAPPPTPPSPLLPEQASVLCSRALEAGQTWADAQARADLMDEGKKSVLAALTEHQMNMGLSKAAAETKALCMPEYTDHVLRMTEARHKALSARIVYDALKKEVDLVRTFEASRRAETQLM